MQKITINISDECCENKTTAESRNIPICKTDFADNCYQNDRLKGLRPLFDFNLFTLGGTGTLLNPGDAYTLDTVTGTIKNLTPGNYLIQF